MPYFFRLPILPDLTIAQQSVLNETKPVSISGGPGTGKSVVSLWRHMQNHGIGRKRSILLTYTNTLSTYLASAARSTSSPAADAVFKTRYWLRHLASRCDEIIVDEAQDLPIGTYGQLLLYAGQISYGADDQQSIYSDQQSTEQQLRALFPDNEPYDLDENFRNTYEIMLFIRGALPNKLIYPATMEMLREKRSGPKPRVVVTGPENERKNEALLGIINRYRGDSHNIAVLVPFADNVTYFHRIIADAKVPCSSYQNDDGFLAQIENVHITTFASAKGTEFDTVIIPNFHDFRYNLANRFAGSENRYYVALTRSRTNLFLISDTVPTDIDPTTFEIDRL
jgi:superfamily I DNA/RNA helicase